MEKYYVNKNPQSTGEHEVHKATCNHLPDFYNRIDLGYHLDCKSALQEARKHFYNVDGCAYCCPACHKK